MKYTFSKGEPLNDVKLLLTFISVEKKVYDMKPDLKEKLLKGQMILKSLDW